jgi:hypothetical protein
MLLSVLRWVGAATIKNCADSTEAISIPFEVEACESLILDRVLQIIKSMISKDNRCLADVAEMSVNIDKILS